jgi:hypothetical protein
MIPRTKRLYTSRTTSRTWWSIVLWMLAATSTEFIGLVHRDSKLLGWFLLPVNSSHRCLPSGHDLMSYRYYCSVADLASTSDYRPTERGVCHTHCWAEIWGAFLYVNPTSWLQDPDAIRHDTDDRGKPEITHNEPRRLRHRCRPPAPILVKKFIPW